MDVEDKVATMGGRFNIIGGWKTERIWESWWLSLWLEQQVISVLVGNPAELQSFFAIE